MDVSHLIDGLNDKQREAVAAPLGNYLVLAGAGSGKTRVLVHRIAWLMQVEYASPFSVLAVTFTNKAAAEMRGRIEQLMQGTASGLWCGTFHGLCHRILRAHHLDANLPQDFQILDSDDQQRLLRRLIKAQNLDEKHWPARQASWYINAKKDEGCVHTILMPSLTRLRKPGCAFTAPIRKRVTVPVWWIFPSYCCVATNCCVTKSISANTTRPVSSIFWWTNSRIPTTSSMPGCV